MSQIFHRSSNLAIRMAVISLGALAVATASGAVLAFWSPWVTAVNENVPQPVQFTHNHHTAGLGIDCRFCHFSVEQSSSAGIPPTKVCMNCHTQLWSDSEILEPVRESWRTEKAIQWNKVHNLADFAYFNHSIHITKGIGCAECHGRIDKMPGIHQVNTLQMRWCLECHTEPEKFVRPKEEVFNMAYEHPKDSAEHLEQGRQLVEAYNIHSKVSCSTCHR